MAVLAGLMRSVAVPPRQQPGAPSTRPMFLDFAYTFAKGGVGFVASQGAVATTLSVQANPGDATITVASAVGVVAGMMLTVVVNPGSPISWPIIYQNVAVTSVAGSVVSLSGGRIDRPFPVGSLVVSTWVNDTHLNYWPAFTQWLLDARVRDTCGGLNAVPAIPSGFTTWTGGALAVPDGWAAIGAPSFVRVNFVATPADGLVNCRNDAANDANAHSCSLQAAASGVTGMQLAAALAVVAGDRWTVTLYAKAQGAVTFNVVDSASSAVIATRQMPLNPSNFAMTPLALQFRVPSGTATVNIQIVPNPGVVAYVGDVRMVRARQDSVQNLTVIRDPGPLPLALIGDSWGVNLMADVTSGLTYYGDFVRALAWRFGRAITVVNSCVSGNTLPTQMTRLGAVLGVPNPPMQLVHLSTFMNDSVTAAATISTQMQELITRSRDVGATPIILGYGNRNTALASHLANNEVIRSLVDTEVGSYPLTDTNISTALAGV